jgi:predicted RNA-binding protein YlqC (UPF0109 family)
MSKPTQKELIERIAKQLQDNPNIVVINYMELLKELDKPR